MTELEDTKSQVMQARVDGGEDDVEGHGRTARVDGGEDDVEGHFGHLKSPASRGE
jgi:hypothetical protein